MQNPKSFWNKLSDFKKIELVIAILALVTFLVLNTFTSGPGVGFVLVVSSIATLDIFWRTDYR